MAHENEMDAYRRQCILDRQLTDWSHEQIGRALAKGRARGRSGWEDPEQCPAQRLIDMAQAHIDRGPNQFVDAAVLLLMAAYRHHHGTG